MDKESVEIGNNQNDHLISARTVEDIEVAGKLANALRLAVLAYPRLPIQLENARKKLADAYGQIKADAMVAHMIAKLEKRNKRKV